jgi:DNA-binding HxlR family transcriptional regulator
MDYGVDVAPAIFQQVFYDCGALQAACTEYNNFLILSHKRAPLLIAAIQSFFKRIFTSIYLQVRTILVYSIHMDTKDEMNHAPAACVCEETLRIIDGKWKMRILVQLTYEGTRRFGELKSLLPGITQRMLTTKLRELENYGIVHRKVYPVVPPKVEYSLTELGRSMQPVLEALSRWGQNLDFPNNTIEKTLKPAL